MIKKLLSKILNAFIWGFVFLLVGSIVGPIIGAFIAELLKTDLPYTTKALILAYAIFGGFLLGYYAGKEREE